MTAQMRISPASPSLIHDLTSRSVFQAATAPTVLKNQLMLQGKSLVQQAHTGTLGSQQPGAEAGDCDGFLHPRAVGILWHFPWLFLAKMISFYKVQNHTDSSFDDLSVYKD